MSNLGSNHTFEKFVSSGVGKSAPLLGQRLAKVTYKGRNGKEAEKESICVSIPPLAGVSQAMMDAMKPHIVEMMCKAQDGIIRGLYEDGKTSVNDAEINDAAILAYLEAQSEGNRLTGEDVAEWFTESLADVLTIALADELGVSQNPTPEEITKVEQKVNQYRAWYVKLSGMKGGLDDRIAVPLRRKLELCASDDLIASRFGAKLDKIIERNNADTL